MKKYKPNLSEYMSLCAANYAKILPLVSAKQADQTLFRYPLHKGCELIFEQIEHSTYTETFQMSQEHSLKWLNSSICRVRLYHDAQVAEVISNSHPLMLAPINTYPNEQMKMPNEKIQMNRFLSQWLNFCLQFGRVDTTNTTYLAFL